MVPAIFFLFSRSNVKGRGFNIYRANDYITIYSQTSLDLWSKPVVSKYLTAIPNDTFKSP